MSKGTGSTLILRPTGKTAITFNLTTATAGVTTYTYIVDLGRVDFAEEDRYKWAYEQTRLGGRVVGSDLALVPVKFPVIIKAASVDYRKEAYRVLQEALMNRRGGTLQYKPEGSDESVLSTYYHYVSSAPPRVLDAAGNRWDSGKTADGFYTIQIDIELQTQPLATSDPDNPVEIIASQTVDNWKRTGLSNQIAVNATALQGSFPALVRLIMEPWSGQNLGRVTMFKRGSEDGTLTNLVSVYEAIAATEIYPSIAWNQAATTIYPTDGRTCSPTEEGNGDTNGLRFTILNPQDCKGRFAVFGLGYDPSGELETWTHQVKLVSGNVSQEGADTYFATELAAWGLIYVGEFELPITELSAVTTGYDAGPYLDWYSTRHSGTSEFTLQALVLVWVSDALGADGDGTALDVVCNDETGVISPERVLIENFTQYGRILERGYVMVNDNDIKRVLKTAPRGDFIELDPAQNHVLVFMQERASGYTVLSDDFESYEATRYLPIVTMETSEDWILTAMGRSTDIIVEGESSLFITTSGEITAKSSPLTQDFNADGRFNDPDYIVLAVYVEDIDVFDYIQLRLCVDDSNYFYHYVFDTDAVTGWNSIAVKKSDFLLEGNPTWATISYVYFYKYIGASSDIGLDYLRIEKADPDNSAAPNPTGTVWDFNSNMWTITDDVTADNAGNTLACLDSGAALRLALLDATIPQDVEITARVMAKKYNGGKVGLAFRMDYPESLTPGSEQGYLACLLTTSNTLAVYTYTSGSITATLSSEFDCEPDRMYTIGIRVKTKGYFGLLDQYDVYAALSSALDYDDTLVFDGENHVITGADFTDHVGTVGVVSSGTLGRCDTFTVKSITDKVYYEDQLRVEGKAIFRTISPFD